MFVFNEFNVELLVKTLTGGGGSSLNSDWTNASCLVSAPRFQTEADVVACYGHLNHLCGRWSARSLPRLRLCHLWVVAAPC